MIDFHCHILPGLDDGSSNVDESIAMAKALAGAGYTRVCCTPHCMKGYYEHTPQQVREATLMLQADLDNAGIDLTLGPGMEYNLDEYFTSFADDLMPLGDSPLVLCEAPNQANPGIIREGLDLIIAKGFIPLIAHPERSQYFYEILARRVARGASHDHSTATSDFRQEASAVLPPRPKNFLQRLFSPRSTRRAPQPLNPSTAQAAQDVLPELCLFQANLGSFTGFYPPGTQQRAYELLKAGVYHCVASDLHNLVMASKILEFGIDKFVCNPILKELARRTTADLRQLAAQMLPEGKSGEQQELRF
jgi:protein-tyrosine phosphatase